MPQGSIRRITSVDTDVSRAVQDLMDGSPGKGGDTYSNRQIAFMLGRQVGTAADRLADDQRRVAVEHNAWVRDQERGAA